MYDVEDIVPNTLKKCKYCNGNGKINHRPYLYWVVCDNCGFSMRYFLNSATAEEAWNIKMGSN